MIENKLPLPPDLEPKIPATDYESDEVRTRVIINHLRSSLDPDHLHIEQLDYNLAVASFLQETNHLNLPDIPASVDMVLLDFKNLRPLTMTQEQLRTCAAHIRAKIDSYITNLDCVPFALRYPNLQALKTLASQRAACPRPLPSGVAVLLLDESKRMLALGIPPKVYKEKPKHLPGEVRFLSLASQSVRT